jgi:hypothetical protein
MGFVYRLLRSGLVPAALASALAACSMHPLPEDVTRVSTVDIVKSIRCEALAGLESLRKEFTPEERERAGPIVRATMIGYDFTFTITEMNGARGASGDPSLGFLTFGGASPFTLDLTGKAALTRANLRRFTIIEPLTDLTKEETQKSCLDRTPQTNWIYPIGGTIGLEEVVRTYVKLEMRTELQAKKPAGWAGTEPVVFSDVLQFTTYLEAGGTTKLILDGGVGRFSVKNVSITADASRRDLHNVIVALTRKPVDVKEPRTQRGAKQRARQVAASMERQQLVKDGSVRDPRTQARLIQVDADARTSIAIELHRRRSLDENDSDNEGARALGQRLLDLLRVP